MPRNSLNVLPVAAQVCYPFLLNSKYVLFKKKTKTSVKMRDNFYFYLSQFSFTKKEGVFLFR
jgi:hypothetical protein